VLRFCKKQIQSGRVHRSGVDGLTSFFLALVLTAGALISPQAIAAAHSALPTVPTQTINKAGRSTSLSLDQLKEQLKKFSIRIICWSPADQKAVIKVNSPGSLSREQWRKVILESFTNILIVKQDNETLIYLLPAGVSSKHVQAVARYTAPTTNPFAEFDRKALEPVKSLDVLPEIALLQKLDSEERKSGIRYERFVNPPEIVSAYSFKVEYVAQLQAMAPINDKSTSQQELTGFPSSGGMLEFIQSQTDKQWLQMRSKSGYLYLTTTEANAPQFTIQQNRDGQETIAMRASMPNGTPFSYTIAKTGNTFTSTINLVSNKGPITLLDFATLGGTP